MPKLEQNGIQQLQAHAIGGFHLHAKGEKSQPNSTAFILEEAPAPPQRGGGREDKVIDSMLSMTTLVQGKPVSSGANGTVVLSIKVYKQLLSVASSEFFSTISDLCALYDS